MRSRNQEHYSAKLWLSIPNNITVPHATSLAVTMRLFSVTTRVHVTFDEYKIITVLGFASPVEESRSLISPIGRHTLSPLHTSGTLLNLVASSLEPSHETQMPSSVIPVGTILLMRVRFGDTTRPKHILRDSKKAWRLHETRSTAVSHASTIRTSSRTSTDTKKAVHTQPKFHVYGRSHFPSPSPSSSSSSSISISFATFFRYYRFSLH